MRIAYLAMEKVDAETGVLRKIAGQMRAWQSAGHEVRLFNVVERPTSVLESLQELPADLFFSRGPLDTFRAFATMARAACAWAPEVAYARLGRYYPALKQLARMAPICLEVNSDSLAELRSYGPRRHYWYHQLTHRSLQRLMSGMVFVTNELAHTPHLSPLDLPRCVIGNGIDLQAYPLLAPPNNPRPRLIFLGSAGQAWHGVDKIQALAICFPEWEFDLVGIPAAALPAAPANLHAHGRLAKSAYDTLLACADIAIGTLALHRNGMDEACPLKVREYLAHGIPTVIGYRDTDFPDDAPFLLRLPNTEENVSTYTEEISQFVARMAGRRVPREAIAQLDVRIKERQRLQFLAQLCRQGK